MPLRSRDARTLLSTFFVVLCAEVAVAQTIVSFTPANPTAADVITVRIDYETPFCTNTITKDVSEATVRMTVKSEGCLLGPGGIRVTAFVVLGPLPAGTYTYVLYEQYEDYPPQLSMQRQLVVAPAPPPIPALSPLSLVVLAVALAGGGLLFLGRA